MKELSSLKIRLNETKRHMAISALISQISEDIIRQNFAYRAINGILDKERRNESFFQLMIDNPD